MFSEMEQSTYLLIRPEFLGPGYLEFCEDILRQKLEGTVQNDAQIVELLECTKVDNGKLQEGTGYVMVPMKYKAKILRLSKDEVVDCEVAEVNKLGFFAEVGSVRVFCSRTSLPDGWVYSETEAISGGSVSEYVYDRGACVIRKQTAIRVCIVATRVEHDKIMAIGSPVELSTLIDPPPPVEET